MKLPQPIYLSGPMSWYPDANREAFDQACIALRGLGYQVLSPHEIGEEAGMQWADYMRKDLPLVARARSMVVLDGWELSRGAQLETYIAHALGMPILSLSRVLSL